MMIEQDEAVKLSQAIAKFLADIAVGHSAATAATYKTGLSRFTAFLAVHKRLDPTSLPVAQLQPDWAVECVRWIAAGQPEVLLDTLDQSKRPLGQLAPKTTTATYVAALTRFYRWAARERLLTLPADEYERMAERLKDLRGKVKRTILSKVPSEDVVQALLAQARKPYFPLSHKPSDDKTSNEFAENSQTDEGNGRNLQAKIKQYDTNRYELIRLRNTALLETLKSSGARVSEICSLTRGDLDATNRRAHVIGKGSKERWLYFSPTAWECVQAYFNRRSQLMRLRRDETSDKSNEGQRTGRKRARASDIGQQPVFARHDRRAGLGEVKPLTPRAVQVMLWELVEAAGLETTITPHKFRHWFATHLLAATGDLAATQDLLGHASPNTTRIYAQVSEQKKQDIHRAVFDQ